MDKELKTNLIITFIISTIIIIGLFFAYKGFYPFNSGMGKDFHYFVYDESNIAFNHSNFKYDGEYYWCRESKKEESKLQYKEKLQTYDKYINKIQVAINNFNSNKYTNYQLNHDISSIEITYKFIDTFGSKRLQRQQEILNNKLEYNKKMDNVIEELEKLKTEVQVEKHNEVMEMLNKYCVKVISN